MSGSLFDHLCDLERELHTAEARRDAARLKVLLHPHFEEFGRSGKRHTLSDVIVEFSEHDPPQIHVQDFELAELAAGVALLTYRSAHIDESGALLRQSLRSSVWLKTDVGWQMRFHQGTPTAFAASA
jgi:hypothetical protein